MARVSGSGSVTRVGWTQFAVVLLYTLFMNIFDQNIQKVIFSLYVFYCIVSLNKNTNTWQFVYSTMLCLGSSRLLEVGF